MCGIFGYVRAARDAPIDLGVAERSLRHRGPDGSGQYVGHVGSWRCGLAHTRLAIIDLSSAGQQPMVSHDGRFVIVYNGEVYNHGELRTALEVGGATFRSRSDTEVILEAYATWGPESLERLRGMFALAIWDTRDGALFLARDRLGIKPLYFTTAGGSLAFSSEVRALLATGATERKLSPEGVASYLLWGAAQEPLTILKGVRALPPGGWLRYRDGHTEAGRFWRPQITGGPRVSLAEASERVRPVLEAAVKLRLVSDVPVGVFLSGGIDSSVVAAIASAAAERPLHTFTVTFSEQAASEAPYAAEVARRLGTEHHSLLLKASTLSSELEDVVTALDQPSADGLNTYFVSRAVRQRGISVALSGLGGDELFAGYANFRTFGLATRVAGALANRGSVTATLVDRLAGLGRVGPKLQALLTEPGWGGAYMSMRSMFTPERVRRLASFPASLDACRENVTTELLEATADQSDSVNVFTVLELSNYLRNTLLRDADVMSMAHGLEVRVPLIDHKLVEEVLRIPGSVKLARHNKPLLRAAGPPIPSSSFRRPKMGFTLPIRDWFLAELREPISRLLAPTSVSKVGLLRSHEVWGMWQAFLSGDPGVNAWRVWCLAALVSWCEKNAVSC